MQCRFFLSVVTGFPHFQSAACKQSHPRDFHFQPAGQGIDNRGTYTVETPRGLIAPLAELTTPAWRTVKMTSTVGLPIACLPTGIPRPWSATVRLPSLLIVTSIRSPKPDRASSTALSTTLPDRCGGSQLHQSIRYTSLDVYGPHPTLLIPEWHRHYNC